MFNKRFMEELFKPQELYSKKAMRTVFDRLAHASIMRLNAASMDKVKHWAKYSRTSIKGHLGNDVLLLRGVLMTEVKMNGNDSVVSLIESVLLVEVSAKQT
jgi:hypothetical protein